MIFDERLIQNGEAGGREAAGLLWNAVMDHFSADPALPSDFKVVTRIYANLKGLGDVCKKSGILSSSSTIEDFARGFTGSKQLFDFVDVGIGKKIFILLLMYSSYYQCDQRSLKLSFSSSVSISLCRKGDTK